MAPGLPKLEIRAPLSGVLVPLDEVPDPVIAGRMVGDGVAIDPTSGEVLAPIAGEVSQLHVAHHALAIASENGLEVLIHVGLDTVALEGRGFTPLVARGDLVECGQPVLRFDPDEVGRRARSLLTAVLVTSGERVVRLQAARGLAEAGKTVVLELEWAGAPAGGGPPEAGQAVLSPPLRLPNAAGLHARPAAVLARAAQKYASRVLLVRGEGEVNAKSIVALMGLSTRRGDLVRLKAIGPDAEAAVSELTRLVASGCGEPAAESLAAPGPAPAAPPPRRPPAPGVRELTGAPASPGLALGRVFQYRPARIEVPETGGTREEERARLRKAVQEAARQLAALEQNAGDPARAQILGVHRTLLEDPELVELTDGFLEEGKSAAFAWQQAFTSHAALLEGLDNPLLHERAADLRDVGRRLLALLAGAAPAPLAVPDQAILVAEELSPSELAGLERTRLLGICTTTGGTTGHVAILARSMGIPAVCGIDETALGLADGTRVAVDGTQGLLRVSPDDAYASKIQERMARRAARREADAGAAFQEAKTRDGHRVEVVANIRNAKDAADALAAGAEGVGLLRSEFLFDERATAPSEDEQAAAYAAVARILGRNRPLVIRTLDVGGDKPLAYLPLPRERNPFLGLRGIRVSLGAKELFRTQLRAILRAAPLGDVHVMFPMVATLDEVREAKQLLSEEQAAFPYSVKVGVMIEVPSAAVMAEVLAREVDFFSIGTNDLTQYTLAADRDHPKVAGLADALHPAVLRMIAMTVEGAHEHGKWVGVCGGLASDALATPLLTGLGVDELSVSVPEVATVKAALARSALDECTALASEVLRLRTAAEVRARLMKHMEEAGQEPPLRVLP